MAKILRPVVISLNRARAAVDAPQALSRNVRMRRYVLKVFSDYHFFGKYAGSVLMFHNEIKKSPPYKDQARTKAVKETT